MTSTAAPRRFSPGAVLAMLLVAYTFNFLDRQILGILAQPIKADLGLSDTQLGALGGIAFAALYSVLGVPLALLADRTSRSWVITVSLVVWSGFTALCGVAANFAQLFVFRVGVGIGEAGGVAPSYALIADYFPPERRARALAIYSLGVPVGLAGGALLGGYIAHSVDWRTAFIAVGLAGIVIAPLFKYVVRDVPRPAAAATTTPIGAVFGIIARKPSFWLLAFGAASSSLCGYGLAFWLAPVLMRSYDFTLIGVGQFAGSLLLIGGTAGVFLGGWLADRMGPGDRGAYARIPALAWLATIPFFAAGLLSTSPTIAWLLLIIPNGLNILWLGPITTAVQHLVPPHMRATASASFLLINNLVGLGLGSLTIGILSDELTPRLGDEALRYAMVAALAFYLIAAVLSFAASRTLKRDWVD